MDDLIFREAKASATMGRVLELAREGLFTQEGVLVYKGHIPAMAFYLVSGEIYLKNNDQVIRSFKDSPILLGVKHVLSRQPVKWDIMIKGKSLVKILDCSTLLSLKNHLSLFL